MAAARAIASNRTRRFAAEKGALMSDNLEAYLQDHLAGALHAIELLKAMRDHNAGHPVAEFAGRLLGEVERDRDALAALNERLGGSSGGPKEWGAWLTEKASRLKLKHGTGDGLGTFEALEFLVLGIHGKRALWRALSHVTSCDPRLTEMDFSQLVARAEAQEAAVEEQRLAHALIALCPKQPEK
ncbi:MAG TPA: hypothetical protein VN933_11920 [Candidatus Eremiobacteraceae bacterium]|nr:hypothetical protein [Candidatus Eremiobacteraceae bacterium]